MVGRSFIDLEVVNATIIIHVITESVDSTPRTFVSVETLPVITDSYIQVRLCSLEILLIVDIEVEEGIALELVPIATIAGTILIVIAPSHDRIGSSDLLICILINLITEVEVEVKFRHPV